MSDVAERRGIDIDCPALGQLLGVPVVKTVARRGDGLDDLRRAVADEANAAAPPPLVIDYGAVIERHLGSLTEMAISFPEVREIAAPRWTVLQLLAGDDHTRDSVDRALGGDQLQAGTNQARTAIAAEVGAAVELALAERRFEWVVAVAGQITGGKDTGRTWSDRFDRVLTHRILGLPVFLA